MQLVESTMRRISVALQIFSLTLFLVMASTVHAQLAGTGFMHCGQMRAATITSQGNEPRNDSAKR